MKFRVLAAAAMLAMATLSSADEPSWAAPERDRAVMLYFSKSFGSGARGLAPPIAFGLRWQEASPSLEWRAASLLDLRWSLDGRKTLLAGGAPMLSLDSMKDEDGDGTPDSSWTWESWKEPGFIVLGVIAVAGGLCLARELICEKKSDPLDSSPSDPPPGNPG
jgi:hypothetical protein